MAWLIIPDNNNNMNVFDIPDELKDFYHLLSSSTSKCLDDAFLEGQSEFHCFSDNGTPIIIVPRNWPPHQDWKNDSNPPRKALIYLDDLINIDYEGRPYNIVDSCGLPIKPIEELKSIVRRCKDHVEIITIYGSYWAAHEFFKIVNKKGDRASTEVTSLFESINGNLPRKILFKFVITKGCRGIQRSSAVEFIHY